MDRWAHSQSPEIQALCEVVRSYNTPHDELYRELTVAAQDYLGGLKEILSKSERWILEDKKVKDLEHKVEKRLTRKKGIEKYEGQLKEARINREKLTAELDQFKSVTVKTQLINLTKAYHTAYAKAVALMTCQIDALSRVSLPTYVTAEMERAQQIQAAIGQKEVLASPTVSDDSPIVPTESAYQEQLLQSDLPPHPLMPTPRVIVQPVPSVASQFIHQETGIIESPTPPQTLAESKAPVVQQQPPPLPPVVPPIEPQQSPAAVVFPSVPQQVPGEEFPIEPPLPPVVPPIAPQQEVPTVTVSPSPPDISYQPPPTAAAPVEEPPTAISPVVPPEAPECDSDKEEEVGSAEDEEQMINQ